MSAEDCPKCYCVMDECECESGAYEDYCDNRRDIEKEARLLLLEDGFDDSYWENK